MKGKLAPQQHFYAVYVPNLNFQTDTDDAAQTSSSKGGNTLGIVCETLQEAVALVKKYEQCGARFKTFTNLNEANSYILSGQTGATPRAINHKSSVTGSPYPVNSSSSSPADEKPPPFGSINRSDLNQFRKAIENCDNDYVQKKTVENPRYLINCNNDSPTILFEGCRYNAMHIAAKSNNLFACKLVLELFTDVAYVARLYPGDSAQVLDNRREFLLDRYLNTPDKALNETPLHFAAKNGYLDIVKMLMSLPACRKDAKNKYGETPVDLAQARCAEVLTTAPNLKLCLEDEAAYVPLYRYADYSVAPFLKPPCIGFPSAILSSEMPGVGAPSPINASACLVALAGPMSVDKAKQFYSEWSSHKIATDSSTTTTTTSMSAKALLSATSRVKRLDLHKGMERLGRRLADHYNVDWSEYWEFLKTLCDIRNTDGLRLFENYLNTKITNKRKLSQEELYAKIKACAAAPFEDYDSSPRRPFSFPTPVRLRMNDKNVPLGEPQVLFRDDSPCRDENENDAFFDSFEFHDFDNAISLLSNNNNAELGDDVDDDVDDEIPNENFATPPETPPTIYIHGDFATKTDFDVFVALENVLIDKSLYPNVRRWYDRISACSTEDRERWPALDSPRIKRNYRRLSRDHIETPSIRLMQK